MDHSDVKHLKVDHTPAELDAASRLLLKAADVIEKHGHATNGDLVTEDGRYCTWGAISYADHGDAYSHGSKAEQEAMRRVSKAVSGRVDELAVCDWNNANDKETVIAKLRAVALAGK